MISEVCRRAQFESPCTPPSKTEQSIKQDQNSITPLIMSSLGPTENTPVKPIESGTRPLYVAAEVSPRKHSFNEGSGIKRNLKDLQAAREELKAGEDSGNLEYRQHYFEVARRIS
jgi:hypothetical protein